jgi:dipeptidase
MAWATPAAVLLLIAPLLPRITMACSTVVVGRAASATGAVMASHSNDGDGCFCHSSINRVPAADWPPNATRMVKGHAIPQVSHTYAYHTEGYGAMNEHQVGLAESTCSGRKWPPLAPRSGGSSSSGGGGGFLDIVQLGKLGLERANTSRMAVQVMGKLSEVWGYADNAESLLVIDPMEAFIFQIMRDPTGNSSVWVAQRVPDDHVGAVTNGLTVREIDFENDNLFLHSQNIRAVAVRHHLWREGTAFDFTKIFAEGGIGEPRAGPQYYVSRRMWVIYKRLAPEMDLGNGTISDYIMDSPLPATVPARRGSVRLQDVMDVMRDYFEDTAYDMTMGMAAGPFGTPDRFGGCNDCGALNETVEGGWERTVATHHSIVSLVMEARSWL